MRKLISVFIFCSGLFLTTAFVAGCGGGASSSPTQTPVTLPALTAIAPVSGLAGSAITLTGSNLGATQGTSTVNFGSTAATVTAWSSTSITATVPAISADAVNVTVTVGGNASNAEAFTVVVAPVLTALSPVSGLAGSTVTLTGSNFGATQGASTVNFGSTAANVTAWSSTSITATVPAISAGAVNVTVTVGGNASNAEPFTVTAAFGITAITPNSGPAGSSVTLSGSQFGAAQSASTVNFGSTAAILTAWSDTSITATVPALSAGAVNVSVTVDGNNSNAVVYTVTVGFSAGIPVSPLLIGQNDWYNLPNAVWPVVQASGVKLVRIGGAQQDNSPMTCDTQQGDLIQQIQMIRSIGAEPVIQVSRLVSGGDLASLATAAAAMVTCVNITNVGNGNLAKPVQYWSIGNEPDYSYSGSADQLAAYAAAYITQISPAMRDVDPGITILAPELSWYDDTKYGYLLGGKSDITGTDSKGRYYIDQVTVHTYPFGASYVMADVLSQELYGIPGMVKALAGRINTANALHNRTGAHALTYGITEFNITYANPSPNGAANLGVCGFLDGQYFASVFATGMAQATATGQSAQQVNPWSINEGGGNCSGGDLGFLGGDPAGNPTPRSTYYHMQMIAQYLLGGVSPGYLAPTSSNATSGVLALATSSNAGAQLAVMILNQDQANSHSFSLRMNSSPVQGPGDTQINIPAGLPVEYSDSIPAQSTMVLQFDALGKLTRKVTYSLADLQASLPPQAQ